MFYLRKIKFLPRGVEDNTSFYLSGKAAYMAFFIENIKKEKFEIIKKQWNISIFFDIIYSKRILLLPGDKIISTSSYAERTYSENILKFAYTHAGYLTDSIGGREYFSYVSWDRGSITRKMYTAAKNKAVPSGLDFSLERKIKGKNSKDTAKTAGRNPIGGSSSKKAAAKTAVGDTGNDKTKRNGWVEYVLKTITAFPDVIEQFDIK